MNSSKLKYTPDHAAKRAPTSADSQPPVDTPKPRVAGYRNRLAKGRIYTSVNENMLEQDLHNYSAAIQDFQRARRQAALKTLIARLKGESNQLLSFEQVRQALKIQTATRRELKEIPLEAIIGSVGRYTDFTREFLPLESADAERWAKVKVAASGLVGLPPIEVYQIGEAYFVKDGNHRVSVARQSGAKFIQAYVTPVQSRVSLSPDTQPDDLILIAEYNNFLERTHFDELLPEADLRVTLPGQYPILLEHIDVHRYFMGLEEKRAIPYQEAALHWYHHVYLPVVELIRALGVLHHFPERTETDLYLWISRHRADLEEQLGWHIADEYVLTDLVETYGENKSFPEKLIELIIPDELKSGTPVGAWRETRTTSGQPQRLFQSILVPINGLEDGWHALEQALVVAQREGAHLLGMHIVPDEEQRTSPQVQQLGDVFAERCRVSNISGSFGIHIGEVAEEICNHARFTDLVVINLSHPPRSLTMKKLSTGFRRIIQQCPRPILVTPQTETPLDHALLAYDGSPKAEEALFLSAYLAAKWNIPLWVVSVEQNPEPTPATLEHARAYLHKRGVEAKTIFTTGNPASRLLEISQEQHCNLLILGGYGHSLIVEAVMGNVVDALLRASPIPMLVCH